MKNSEKFRLYFFGLSIVYINFIVMVVVYGMGETQIQTCVLVVLH